MKTGGWVGTRYFVIGQRLQLHPGTDQWMQGDRWGTVVKTGLKYVHLKMDVSGRILKVKEGHLNDE